MKDKKDKAREILEKGPSDPVWFVRETHALSGENSLVQFEKKYEDLAKTDRKRAVYLDSAAKVPDAYAILYAILHSSKIISPGEVYYGKKEGVEKEEGVKAEAEKAEAEDKLITVEQENYYEILGVPENANSKEIEIAFQKKIKTFNLNELEKNLRSQGLSDYEIRSRLEKARQEYENLREAYAGVGNEQNRKYYDDFRKQRQESGQKGGSYSQRKGSPTGNPLNWEILGVGPNPTQLELRDAYRKLAKEFHPDAYLAKLGKRREELTPEEVKTLNEMEEKLRDINLAYDKERDQQKLNQEIAEKRERESKEEKKTPQNIVVETTPTVPETEITKKELEKVKSFRETVEDAGEITFSPEETIQLKSAGVVNPTMTSEEFSASATTALQLHSMGVKANEFSDAADNAKFLTTEQGQSLQQTAFIMEALEVGSPQRSESLHKGNLEPTVAIKQIPASVTTPQPNQLILQPQGDGLLRPILEKGLEFAKGKAEKLLEKTGLGASKKLISETLKKEGSKLLTKIGSKIAVKAGITVTAQTVGLSVPIIGNIIAFIATEIVPKLIGFVKKAISSILRFITGKDDLKSQIKELAGIATVFFLATGAIIPAIISGGLFVGSLGVGSILGGVSAAFHTFVFLISSIILAVSLPIIISVLVFLFLVIFSVIIINNSAFVVPEGGFGNIGFDLSTIPPGAQVGLCTGDIGADITQQIAGRVDSGVVNLLPISNGARSNPYCIVPTMIILHSSGGYDNDDGNNATYNTLVSRNLACQLGTDTNDTWVMQPFYENQVEMAWCANSWNAYGISIEIAGEGPVSTIYQGCGPYNTSLFNNPPPHPCDPETDLAFSAVCTAMQQYGIPWCQVYTHADVPNSGKNDINGKEWVRMFIERLRNTCRTRNDSSC